MFAYSPTLLCFVSLWNSPYRQNKAVSGKFDCGVARLIVFFVCVENKGIYWAFDGGYEFDNGDIV